MLWRGSEDCLDLDARVKDDESVGMMDSKHEEIGVGRVPRVRHQTEIELRGICKADVIGPEVMVRAECRPVESACNA